MKTIRKSWLRGFWIVIGIMFVVAILAVFMSAETKRVFTKECPICRLKKKEVIVFSVVHKERLERNVFSNWYSTIDPTHTHSWFSRADMGYSFLGKVRYTAYVPQQRFFLIDPRDEKDFLESHFSTNEIRIITKHLMRSEPADALYFAMYTEGTNAQAQLKILHSWLDTISAK